ncbi:hypothetical protein Tco_0191547 [Tanacetum coccineum]
MIGPLVPDISSSSSAITSSSTFQLVLIHLRHLITVTTVQDSSSQSAVYIQSSDTFGMSPAPSSVPDFFYGCSSGTFDSVSTSSPEPLACEL